MKLFTRAVFALSIPLMGQTQPPGAYRISGPFTHDNLSIFLLHGANKPVKNFLTLEEAIDQHKAVVYETRNVNELAIENLSDEDVFIESGDIVKGGAQDRTLKDDLILPSKSGKVSLSAFCVEHGRWIQRGNESVSTFNGSHDAVSSKELKMAVRMKADQVEVWNQVAQAQASMSSNLRANVRSAAAPTSLAMTMDAPVVQRSIDGYIQELAGIVNGKNDVIGYAFAIDGKVNSADVYSSHDLFAKLWMKQLRANCIEAVMKNTGKNFEPATISNVKNAIQDAEAGKPTTKDLTARTEVVVKESAQNVMFETRDRAQNNAWVHRNYMTKQGYQRSAIGHQLLPHRAPQLGTRGLKADRRKPKADRRKLVMCVQLPRLNANRQSVLLRRQRACGIRRERTGRIVRLIEIEYDGVVLRKIGLEKPSRRVSLLARCFIAKDEEQFVTFHHRIKAQGFSIECKQGITGAGLLGDLSENICDRDGHQRVVADELRGDAITLLGWKPAHARELLAQGAFGIAHSDAEAVAAMDDK